MGLKNVIYFRARIQTLDERIALRQSPVLDHIYFMGDGKRLQNVNHFEQLFKEPILYFCIIKLSYKGCDYYGGSSELACYFKATLINHCPSTMTEWVRVKIKASEG